MIVAMFFDIHYKMRKFAHGLAAWQHESNDSVAAPQRQPWW
jgi:hypothetical protein